MEPKPKMMACSVVVFVPVSVDVVTGQLLDLSELIA